MKIRLVAVVLLAAGLLAACSSSSGKSGGPTTGSSVDNTPVTTVQSTPTIGTTPTSAGTALAGGPFCTKLAAAQNKLSSLQQDVGNMDALKAGLKDEIAAFKKLASGAPPDVAASINDMVTLLSAASQQLSKPSSDNAAALSDLASKLPADAEKIGSYVAANCSS